MSQPYLGEIRIFAGNFAPQGWALCMGQLLAISQYDTLFNLIGTTYGGDGLQTFALPNLQGRVPVGTGTGAGLSTRTLGQLAGAEGQNVLQPTTKVTGSGASAIVSSTQTIPTVSPVLAINFILALNGIYPTQN